MSLTRFLLLLIIASLPGVTPLRSQETPVASPEAVKVLKESRLNRAQALQDSFNPVIGALSGGDYRSLYLNAVYAVFFANNLRPQPAFRDWQKKNAGLVNDPRLPEATRLAAANLRGHLYLILGDESQAVGCFLSVLRGLRDGPDNLAGFHLFQESLNESLLTKYYHIESEYLNEDGGYTGAIGNLEHLFTIAILPWHEKNNPQEIAGLWDSLIMAKSKMASLSDQAADRFALTGQPELLLAKAESLAQNGQKKQAVAVLKDLLQKFPMYPKYQDIEAKFLQLSGEAK
jgi:hypothetical protein